MFCVVLFPRAHNVVFFPGKRKINFRHLSLVVGEHGGDETGSYYMIFLSGPLKVFVWEFDGK